MPTASPILAAVFTCFLSLIKITADPSMPAAQPTRPPSSPTDLLPLLQKLRPGHLLFPPNAEKQILANAAADPELAALWHVIHLAADSELTQPPLTRTLTGRRLLGVSRDCVKRVTHLAMAYRLTGDAKYADRAKAEMLNVAAFSDWNPSHFLDVAEMTTALALGTDWLDATLDDATRKTLHTAIIEKGLKPSLDATGWPTGTNNWNQVCNTGMVLGALAVAPDSPENRELAARILARAIAGLPHAMAMLAPDGAYPEGPAYWEYGTTYNVILVAALRSALDTDFGLAAQPGFLASADYYLHATGPTGRFFNYSDCGQRGPFDPAPAMFYLAELAGKPWLAHNERVFLADAAAGGDKAQVAAAKPTDRMLPLALLWAKPMASDPLPPELSYHGTGPTPVAMHRTSWAKDATYVAIKGGSAQVSHSHIDQGAFVIDALGTRWAEELGMQDYNSLESKGVKLWDMQESSDRWKIYRLGSHSHSILSVDGQQQNIFGKAEIISSNATQTVLDLTLAYKGQLTRAIRTITLAGDAEVTSVELKDEFTAAPGTKSVRWQWMTRAKVEKRPGIKGALTLHRDGKEMYLRVYQPQGAAVDLHILATDPKPTDLDAPNPGVTVVGFDLPATPGTPQQIIVQLDNSALPLDPNK